MNPQRPRSELSTYPPPPPHHVPPSTGYVYLHHNGDVGGDVPVQSMERPYQLSIPEPESISSYPIARGTHGGFLQPQMHPQPLILQQPPSRSILTEPQARLHYHGQYDNNPQPPLQFDHLNDEQADLSTEDYIHQDNTESMINDSVNEAFLTTAAASSMPINDGNAHAHLAHQHPANYNSPNSNIYNLSFPYNANQCVTSISSAAAEEVLNLSKADDLTLPQQFKEEPEMSPLQHENQYQQPDNQLPVPFESSRGQQSSVIVHTDNLTPISRSSVPETNSEDCGPFRILTPSSVSPAKDRRFRAFPTNRPSNPYLHANHFGDPNLLQQQMPFHHHQYNNILSEMPEQKPMLAANHLTEPVVNYSTAPVTSSPQQFWNGGYTSQNQLNTPPISHPRLNSSNASSISAIIDMNNQLSQRHFSDNSAVGERLMHHLTHGSPTMENHYNTATTTPPSNFSPGTQLQMMHEDTNYVHPVTSTPGPSPKKTKSPRNSGSKMGRGRGIQNLAQTSGSPDVAAPFQIVQNHHNPVMKSPVEGKIPKKGRGRGKKVVANILDISCAESDFGAVEVSVNSVDLNKSLNVFTPEELQRHAENGEVVMKKKRPYKKRAPKPLNNSVDSGSSPEKPIRKTSGPKLNRKNKSNQTMEPAQSQQDHLPDFKSITRDVLNIPEDNLSSPSQVINIVEMGRGRGRGLGARRSTGEGRGGGVRKSTGEGRGGGVRKSTGEGRGGAVRKSTGEGRGRGIRKSIGEGRGRGNRRPPASRINDEMTGSQMPSNAVDMVISSQYQVPWVGPPPGSNDFPVDGGVAPNNHTGLYQVNQAPLSKPLQQYQNQKNRRVIVGGKPLEIPENIISKTLPVLIPSVIPSNQLASTSAQVQMAETGELPMSSAGVVPHSRAFSAKGQRKSYQPKVSLELYKGSDDEIDSNAEDEDDEDYEDLERRQRITRRKSGRVPQQRGFADNNTVDIPTEKDETFYFPPGSVPSHVNGLPNEMPVSANDIEKEDDENDNPMHQQQQEAENLAETANSLQQISVPLENAEGIQNVNVKQEIVEEGAEVDTGTSEMQVDTEGTFGDAESGLVVATLPDIDIKPVVGLLHKGKNRRLLSTQRQPKRPIKRPRVPMQESSGSNYTPGGVAKRGRKKKSVIHEEVVVKTEEIECRPRELVEKSEIKIVIPKYTDEDKQLLYADKRFVIDISSVDKAPDQVYIWQIIESENCLRQYYPSKYGEKQFFLSSPVKWYFFEEEFKSDEFYSRFIPIVVVIANVIPQTIERLKEVSTSDECTVQYVHVDKPFFVRMLKCIGQIDTIEFLRPHFMHSLVAFTLIAIDPLFFSHDVRNPSLKKFSENLESWVYLRTYLYSILERVYGKCPFGNEILQNLMDYPSMKLSAKDVKKSEACLACHRPGSVPCLAIKFPVKGHMEKPYHKETLIELAPGNFPQPPEPMSFCRGCATAARKLHRFIHFPYFLLKLIKQNIAKDVATFRTYRTQISDEILVWIQRNDVSWKNVMFLDFQMSVCEVKAEFFPRLIDVVDAPVLTPPIANPTVVPNEN